MSFSKDKKIRVWDLNSGECLKILRGHKKYVAYIKVISYEKIIIGSGNEIKIRDFESVTCL